MLGCLGLKSTVAIRWWSRRTGTVGQGRMMGAALLLTGFLAILGVPETADGQARNPVWGEVVFSELMIEPGAGQPKWLEFSNRTNEALTLDGCQILRLNSTEITTLGPLMVPANGHVMIRSSRGTSPAFPSECNLEEDDTYPTVQLPVSSANTIRLQCPTSTEVDPMEAVDEVAFDWRPYRTLVGTSLVRDMASNAWCPGIDEGEVCSGLIGSPGEANTTACQGTVDPGEFRAPVAGEVLFSELMIKPVSGQPEWIEFKNEGLETVSLEGCRLFRPATGQNTILGTIVAEAGEYIFIRKSGSTIFPEECSLTPDGTYSTVSLVDSAEDTVQLQCPDTAGGEEVEWETIDEVTFLWSATGGSPGTSLVRDLEEETVTWCLGSDEPLVCAGLNASPGAANAGCDGGTVDPGGDPNPVAGEVIFSELMIEPVAGPKWIELRNLIDKNLSLKDCQLFRPSVQSSNTATLGPVAIQAEGYALLARSGTDWPLECGDTPDGTFGTISMVVSSEDTIQLLCPVVSETESTMELVDQVTFNWSAHRTDKGSSLIYDLEKDSWCVGKNEGEVCSGMVASPGAANAGCDGGTVDPGGDPNPVAGEVIFSELMIEPSDGHAKWIEFKNNTGKKLSLEGCRIFRPSVASSNSAMLGAVVVPENGYVFLSRSDYPVDCGDAPDGTFGTISLILSGPDSLQLQCPIAGDDQWAGEPIDVVDFNWKPYREFKGTSLTYDNVKDAWCVGEEEGEVCAGLRGSPGAANAPCSVVDPGNRFPMPGEIVITELMIEPSDNHTQWVELQNLSSEALSLTGCRLRRTMVSTSSTAVLGTIGVEANGIIFLAKGTSYPADCGPTPDGTYGTISMKLTGEDALALECPIAGDDQWAGEPIDTVVYNWGSKRRYKGSSFTRDPATGEWCVGTAQELMCEGLKGSPGVINAACEDKVNPVLGGDDGCGCVMIGAGAAAGRGGSMGSLLLVMVGLVSMAAARQSRKRSSTR